MRRLLFVSLLLSPLGCDEGGGAATDVQAPVADMDTLACQCESPGAQRCAGSVVEICEQGRWVEKERCPAPTTCFAAQCFESTTACPTSVRYDGYTELGERSPAVMLDACVAGGDIGRTVTLDDSTPFQGQRSLLLAYPNGCPEPVLDFDSAFGIDVDGVVVSQSPSLTFDIPAGEQGALFRQTEQFRRIGLLMNGNQVSGTVIVTDYTFTYGADVGPQCPPESSLPPQMPLQNSCAWHEYNCVPCGS